jgi:hypothetical protein
VVLNLVLWKFIFPFLNTLHLKFYAFGLDKFSDRWMISSILSQHQTNYLIMQTLIHLMHKMKRVLMVCKALFLFNVALAQQGVAINNDGSVPDNSAILDIKSVSKGVLVPRLTGIQKNSIVSPAMGLLVYQTDGTPGFYYYNGSSWMVLSTGQGGGSGWSMTWNTSIDSIVQFYWNDR